MAKSGNLDNGRKKWCNNNTTVEAIRMTEKEIVNVRTTVILLRVMVKNTKRSLQTVP